MKAVAGDADGDRILDDVDAWMEAYSFGGEFPDGKPRVVVIHCTEGPLNDGVAESLMGPNWFGGPKAGTSCHFTGDSNSIVQGVRLHRLAWHCGPAGNGIGIGFEFCGRVAMTKAEWRSPAAMAMLRIQATRIADALKYCGAPPRWLSLTQLAAGERGMCTHNDIRLALGGTTHSDPGPNFPYAELLELVTAAHRGTTPTTPAPTAARRHDMFLFRRKSPPSGVRLFTAAAKPISADLGDETTAEISKALADPTHIASVPDPQFSWLLDALK